MFYSQVILAKKGPLGKIWIAAHFDKKLTKQQIFSTDITASVDLILSPVAPLSLRVSGHLMLGVIRIYSKKVKYLLSDCTEAMWKMRMSFRPGKVDMDVKLLGMGVDDHKYFGSIPPIDLDYPTLDNVPFDERLLPLEWGLPSVPASPVIPMEVSTGRREVTPFPFPGRRPSISEISGESRLSDVHFMRDEDSRLSVARSAASLERRRASSLGAGTMEEELPAFEEEQLFEEMRYDQGLPTIAETMQESYYSPPLDVFRREEHLERRRVSPIPEEGAVSPVVPMEIEGLPPVPPSLTTITTAIPPPPGRKTIDISEFPMPAPRRRPERRDRVHIDERVELSNVVLRERMQNPGPTLRRNVDDPLPFELGFSAIPSFWDTLEQRLDIRYGVRSSDMRELLDYVTNTRPFPFPLKRPRLEGVPPIPSVPYEVPSVVGPPSEARRSISSMESAADKEFIRRLSSTDIARSRTSQAAFQQGDQIDMREVSFEQQELSFGRDSGMFPEAYAPPPTTYEVSPPTLPPFFEELPTELSKRVEEVINTYEATLPPKTIVSERSKGIYGLINDLFSRTEQVTLQELVSGCSRKTAATCFLEILQLKTADKINISQQIAYGDIEITPIPLV